MKLHLFALFFVLAAIGLPIAGLLLSKNAQEAHSQAISKDRLAKEAQEEVRKLARTHTEVVAEKNDEITRWKRDFKAVSGSGAQAKVRIEELERNLTEVRASKETVEAENSGLKKQVEILSSGLKVVQEHQAHLNALMEKASPEQRQMLRSALARIRFDRREIRPPR